MQANPITAKAFKLYISNLRTKLQNHESAMVLAEPIMLMILDNGFLCNKGLVHSDVNSFFNDDEKTISAIAIELYRELMKIYIDYPKNVIRTLAISEISLATKIKNTLRIIKYSCTIIDDNFSSTSIFQNRAVLDAMQSDIELNPSNWKYLTYEQFTIKFSFSLRKDNIVEWISPISNYRITDLFNSYKSFPKHPLVVLNDQNYTRSIDNLVAKYIVKDTSTHDWQLTKPTAETLYIGHLESNYEASYTRYLKALYSSIKEVISKKFNDQFEIVLAIEYVPKNASIVAIFFKLYLFKYTKNIGYVLHSFITASLTNQYSTQVFFTKSISTELIRDVLQKCLDFFRDESNEIKRENDTNSKSHIVQTYSLLFHLLTTFDFESNKPSIPNLIIYPQ